MSQRVRDIIISSVISIAITIVFGYYFLYVGVKEREPTFYLEPVRTTIIDKANTQGAPLQLLKPNGDTIDSDVVSVYFYFFNQGKETIKHENIYAPLRIKVEGEAEILDFKVLKVARRVSGINVSLDSASNSLELDFKALEEDDGLAGQLIFEGDKNSAVVIEGGVDGVKQFEYELSNVDPVYMLIAIFIFLVAAYIFLIVSRRNPKNVPKFLFFFSALPVLYLLLMLYRTEWFVDHKVPQTLRTEQHDQETRKALFQLPAWFE